jgi:hypothetical protein
MDSKLKELFAKEQKNRESKSFIECLGSCIKIIDHISNYKEDQIFDNISKLLLFKNQSNFVRIGIIFHLVFSNYININDNKNIKRKYYQLLIDSFKEDTINDKENEKNNIIKLFEESELKHFKSLDSYLLTLDSIFMKEKSNSSDRDLFSPSEKDKNIIKYEPKNIVENVEISLNQDESQQNQITHYGLVEEINLKQSDISNTLENIMIDGMTSDNEKYLLKKYKANNKLPMILVSVSVNLSSGDFMKLIESTFTKLNYRNICNIKSNPLNNINIYEYNPKNIMERIAYCMAGKRTFIKSIFQVIVMLKKDDNNFTSGLNYYLNDNYERKITIKTVRGSEKNVTSFMLKYLKLISSSVNKIKVIKQSKNFYKYNLESTLNEQITKRKNLLLKSINMPKKKQLGPPEVETLVEKSNKEANQYYELYKILSNKEYELGKSVNDFIENFRNKYKEITSPDEQAKIEEINTKPLMVDIVKTIELSMNTLNSNFNNISSSYNSTMYYNASEQFIFNKIFHLLYDIYDKKYKKENEEFLSIKKDINDNMKPCNILINLSGKDIYKGFDEAPYKNVIENINKVKYEKSLKNKFTILTQCSLEMRGSFLEYTSGKDELVSMDDELPIIIYIVTQVNIDNLFAELNMVDDYIKTSMRDELIQNKMVTNMLSSLIYVCKKWDTKIKKFNS